MADAEGLDLLHKQMEFSGCKISLISDDRLLTILRDEKRYYANWLEELEKALAEGV